MNGGCQGLRGGRIGEGLSNSAEFSSSRKMEELWRQMVAMLSHSSMNGLTATKTVHFQTSYDGQLHVTRYVTDLKY